MDEHEELARDWTAGALVFITRTENSAPMIRPAAFVYPIGGSITWVEPAYADPYGTPSPAMHTRVGKVTRRNDSLLLTSENGEQLTFDRYRNHAALVGDALEWFARHVTETGLDWLAERERLWELIRVDVAELAYGLAFRAEPPRPAGISDSYRAEVLQQAVAKGRPVAKNFDWWAHVPPDADA